MAKVNIVSPISRVGMQDTEKEKSTVDFTEQLQGPKDIISREFSAIWLRLTDKNYIYTYA